MVVPSCGLSIKSLHPRSLITGPGSPSGPRLPTRDPHPRPRMRCHTHCRTRTPRALSPRARARQRNSPRLEFPTAVGTAVVARSAVGPVAVRSDIHSRADLSFRNSFSYLEQQQVVMAVRSAPRSAPRHRYSRYHARYRSRTRTRCWHQSCSLLLLTLRSATQEQQPATPVSVGRCRPIRAAFPRWSLPPAPERTQRAT